MSDVLKEMLLKSYQDLPFELNQKRYTMDMIQFPRAFFHDASDFIRNCTSVGASFIAALYGEEYQASDFNILQKSLEDEKFMLCIQLPLSEDFSSLDSCSAFVILYSLNKGVIASPALYAVVESNYGWRRIVHYTSEDHNEFICSANESIIANLELILQRSTSE